VTGDIRSSAIEKSNRHFDSNMGNPCRTAATNCFCYTHFPPIRQLSRVKRGEYLLFVVESLSNEPNVSFQGEMQSPVVKTNCETHSWETANMSRLDSFIRRMHAQCACLDYAARLITSLPGNVLEFGLGNGRTFDHLRERLPTRDIYVFDQMLAAHAASVPDVDKLFLGDVVDTMPRAAALLGRKHFDSVELSSCPRAVGGRQLRLADPQGCERLTDRPHSRQNRKS
jgi:hypothetical protein